MNFWGFLALLVVCVSLLLILGGFKFEIRIGSPPPGDDGDDEK